MMTFKTNEYIPTIFNRLVTVRGSLFSVGSNKRNPFNRCCICNLFKFRVRESFIISMHAL